MCDQNKVVFQECPTGRRPRGRPVSQLVQTYSCVSPHEQEKVGRVWSGLVLDPDPDKCQKLDGCTTGWTSNLPNTIILSKKPFTSMIPYIKNKCLLLPLWATNAGESRLVWYEFACGANNFALPYAESLHISSIFRQNLKLRSGCSCSNVRLCCFVCFFVFWTARCTKQDIYRDFLELWEPGIDIFKISTKQRINNRSKIKQISSSGQWKNERSHRKAS